MRFRNGTNRGHRLNPLEHWSVGTTALSLALAAVVLVAPSLAGEAEDRGLEIAQKMDKRDDGFTDSAAELVMVLRNKKGDESRRQMRSSTLEMANDGDRSLVVFNEPADVKGSAFLSFTHKAGPDDQWLYLPALKRVKRIASNNKSGPFMGSEFAYEDIASQEVEKYAYKYIRDEVMDETDCFVVERYPVDKKSGYTRQIVWVNKAEYRPEKIEYYDRKDSLLKTLTFHGYNLYQDQYWRADEMHMVNHQTSKGTILQWKNYQFKSGLSERDFDKNSLKRAR